ncbi:MAG: amidase family protein [Chloroflexi bacterium]|nr:amidase family protein [Chloroflexota bacterium]MDA1145638.1 amidase family protein [Chloroflexota bacterium]
MSELWQLSAAETARLVRAREISAVEVTRSVLERLASVNPTITAVVDEFPEEALAEAARVDETIARGEDPGALAGVPVTIKVVTDQAGHATTGGLLIQRDNVAQVDSPVVSNFRKAGAVIVGRTNTPAFSLHWFTRNRVHGHTRNPRNPALTPGGSSGGAAAAVAAGIGAIGQGTDIAGSVRYPAYACGIHGLRPSLGRVPQHNASGGDRNIGGQLMAVAGPIARTIEDLRLGLEAMSAENLRDPCYAAVPVELPLGPKRAAMCVAPEGLDVAPEVEAAVRDAARRLEADGWTVEEVETPPIRLAGEHQARLWLGQYRQGDYGAFAREDDPDANFAIAHMEARCPAPNLDQMMETLRVQATLTRQWRLFLEEYPVLLCPVSSELPFPDLLMFESGAAFERVMEAQLLQIAFPFMGLPGLTVSTGIVDTPLGPSPVGVQLVAGRHHEARLLRAGAAIERGGTPPSPVDPRG